MEKLIKVLIVQLYYSYFFIITENFIQEIPRIRLGTQKKNNKIVKFKKGDIIFWKGHVALCLDATRLIHAYGPKKKVLIMQTNYTIKKIRITANLTIKKISNILS